MSKVVAGVAGVAGVAAVATFAGVADVAAVVLLLLLLRSMSQGPRPEVDLNQRILWLGSAVATVKQAQGVSEGLVRPFLICCCSFFPALLRSLNSDMYTHLSLSLPFSFFLPGSAADG